MKLVLAATLMAALSLSTATFAQSSDMGNMKMEDKGMHNCMDMKGMKDMDMKGMDAKKCQEMMKGMDKKSTSKAGRSRSHEADAVVKGIDAERGKVTLAHDPVKSLGWPAMTTGFAVKDKALFDKLAVGKKVHVQFKKEDADYVVTLVR